MFPFITLFLVFMSSLTANANGNDPTKRIFMYQKGEGAEMMSRFLVQDGFANDDAGDNNDMAESIGEQGKKGFLKEEGQSKASEILSYHDWADDDDDKVSLEMLSNHKSSNAADATDAPIDEKVIVEDGAGNGEDVSISRRNDSGSSLNPQSSWPDDDDDDDDQIYSNGKSDGDGTAASESIHDNEVIIKQSDLGMDDKDKSSILNINSLPSDDDDDDVQLGNAIPKSSNSEIVMEDHGQNEEISVQNWTNSQNTLNGDSDNIDKVNFSEDDEDHSGLVDSMGDDQALTHNGSSIAYHREQATVPSEPGHDTAANQELLDAAGVVNGPKDIEEDIGESGAPNIEHDSIGDSSGSENSMGNEGDVNSQGGNTPSVLTPLSCDVAASCLDCLSFSIERLKLNQATAPGQTNEPCYWVLVQGDLRCTSTSEPTENNTGEYKCTDDGSAFYTNRRWEDVLAELEAMSIPDQVPVSTAGELGSNTEISENQFSDAYEGYQYGDEDEDNFFDMIQSTFNILILSAFFASMIILRGRVQDRLRADPSVGLAGAVRGEIVKLVTDLASWAFTQAGGDGNSGRNELSNDNPSTGHSAFGQESVPLSTATDEEWGWEEDDSTPNLELSGIGGDAAAREMSKEEDDLALAIAMSLSETNTSLSQSSNGSNKLIESSKSLDTKSKTQVTSSKPTRQQQQNVTQSVRESGTLDNASTSTSENNSIEELLGALGNAGGPVITSFGQRPKVVPTKPKTKTQEKDPDDIFASMGLSSFPPKSTGGSMPATSAKQGWKHSTTTVSKEVASKSAPSPSLVADSSLGGDDDDDWGDDGDLDDLLDD